MSRISGSGAIDPTDVFAILQELLSCPELQTWNPQNRDRSTRNKISGKFKKNLSTIRDGVESIPHTFDQIEFYVQKPVWYLIRALSHEKKVPVRRPFVVGNPGNLKEKKRNSRFKEKTYFWEFEQCFGVIQLAAGGKKCYFKCVNSLFYIAIY